MTKPTWWCLLLLAGCATGGSSTPPGHFDVYVDPSANAAEVVSAAAAWNAATGSDIEIFASPCAGCWAIESMPSADLDAWAVSMGSEREEYWGLTVANSRTIAIDSALTGDELRVTTIHELGHMMGLLHPCPLGVPCDAIMGPQYGFQAEHVTAGDVRQYEAVDQ